MQYARKTIYVNGQTIQPGEEIPEDLLDDEAVADHVFMESDKTDSEVEEIDDDTELDDLTVPQLQTRLRHVGGEVRPGMKKADLIEAIEKKLEAV